MKLSIKLKPTWWDGVIVALCALAAAGCWLWFVGSISDHRGDLVAVITVSGVEVRRMEVESETELALSANGYTLELRTGEEGISVCSSDCPGQDCMRMGWIDQAGKSIVCLPAQVAIRLEYSGENQENDIDAVIG